MLPITYLMTSTLVYDALQMALWRRSKPKNVFVHSNRGRQYCSNVYRDLIRKNSLIQSISRKGNYWDIGASTPVLKAYSTQCKLKPYLSKILQTIHRDFDFGAENTVHSQSQ